MACGFFTVLILEKVVLSFREAHRDDERAPLLAPAGHGHADGHHSLNDLEGSGHHVHVDLHAHSSFRSFMLFLSLSLHSVFEGLAIGLQTTDTKVIESTLPGVSFRSADLVRCLIRFWVQRFIVLTVKECLPHSIVTLNPCSFARFQLCPDIDLFA